MNQIKNFLTKTHAKTIGKLPTSLQNIIRKLSKICLGVFAVYLVFYLYTWPLREPSYSRDVSTIFIYKGDEYTVNSEVKCINRGVAIDEGNMRWYADWNMETDWDLEHNNQAKVITLNDSERAMFYFRFLICNTRNKNQQIFTDSGVGNDIVAIHSIEQNPQWGHKDTKKSENPHKRLDIKIQSIKFGKKQFFPDFFNK